MYRELQYLSYLWDKARHLFELKLMIGILTAVVAYLYDPAQAMALYALFFLVIGDFFFGVAAAKKTGRQITSARFARTPIKLVIYFSLIACAHVSEFALPVQLGFLDETITGFLAATELLSIFEKSGYLGYAIPRSILNQLHYFREDGQTEDTQQNSENIIG